LLHGGATAAISVSAMRFISLALAIFTSLTAAADNQNPTVSPDGSRIAFISDRDGTTDVYVMAADGSHQIRLTRTEEKEGKPIWSADGKAIRFTVPEKDSSRLYSVDLRGTRVAEIGKVPGRGVLISRDGKRVFYALGTWTEVQLMESDLDGANARQLTDGKSVVWSPRWSPNGKQIAFTGRDAESHMHIYLMNPDGSSLRQLTHFEVADGRAQSPAWSPDARWLAVQADTEKKTHIWIIDATTGAGRKLAAHEEALIDETPDWFPDGKRIAFTSNRSGKLEVWTMNVDGLKLRQLTGR